MLVETAPPSRLQGFVSAWARSFVRVHVCVRAWECVRVSVPKFSFHSAWVRARACMYVCGGPGSGAAHAWVPVRVWACTLPWAASRLHRTVFSQSLQLESWKPITRIMSAGDNNLLFLSEKFCVAKIAAKQKPEHKGLAWIIVLTERGRIPVTWFHYFSMSWFVHHLMLVNMNFIVN